jgi:hypothetical protein
MKTGIQTNSPWAVLFSPLRAAQSVRRPDPSDFIAGLRGRNRSGAASLALLEK